MGLSLTKQCLRRDYDDSLPERVFGSAAVVLHEGSPVQSGHYDDHRGFHRHGWGVCHAPQRLHGAATSEQPASDLPCEGPTGKTESGLASEKEKGITPMDRLASLVSLVFLHPRSFSTRSKFVLSADLLRRYICALVVLLYST